MNCSDFNEMLSLYFDGELTEEKELEMLGHIGECENCRKEYEEYEKIKSILESVEDVPLPEGGHDKIMWGVKKSARPKNKFIKTAEKFNRRFAATAAAVAVVLVVAAGARLGFIEFNLGAGAAAPKEKSAVTESAYDIYANGTATADYVYTEETMDAEVEMKAYSLTAETPALSEEKRFSEDREVSENSASERLIIKNLYANLEVEDYEEAVKSIQDMVNTYGGYIQDSYTWDSGYYEGESIKSGEMTLRIPKEHYESVKAGINGLGRVTEENETSSDITSQYVETEGRLSALKIEQERLLEILGECKTVDEIIAVEERLGEVRADIEIYQNQINNWDRLVQFSTIRLSIYEKQPAKVYAKPEFSQRARSSFISGINSFTSGWQNFAVGFVGNIFGIALIVVIVIIAVKVVKKVKAKKNNR